MSTLLLPAKQAPGVVVCVVKLKPRDCRNLLKLKAAWTRSSSGKGENLKRLFCDPLCKQLWILPDRMRGFQSWNIPIQQRDESRGITFMCFAVQCPSVWGHDPQLPAGFKPQTRVRLWASEEAGRALDDLWPGLREEHGQGLTQSDNNQEKVFPLLRCETSLSAVSPPDPTEWSAAGLLQRRRPHYSVRPIKPLIQVKMLRFLTTSLIEPLLCFLLALCLWGGGVCVPAHCTWRGLTSCPGTSDLQCS